MENLDMACRIRIKGNRGSGIRDRGSEIRGLGEVMKLKKYQDLEVWLKAMDLVVMCCQIAGESRRIQC
ncbi:MAG: hypothetical protein LWX54_04275 [Deltaproteobacteria bacterium]|jgi:hypothetical protein|nr:hypothetical protein [Deltaproteobacteria bacterium]